MGSSNPGVQCVGAAVYAPKCDAIFHLENQPKHLYLGLKNCFHERGSTRYLNTRLVMGRELQMALNGKILIQGENVSKQVFLCMKPFSANFMVPKSAMEPSLIVYRFYGLDCNHPQVTRRSS